MSLRGPTALTTGTNLVILGSNALAGVISARLLGPTGRGQLAVVVLWSAVIGMLGCLGMPSSLSYYVASWPDRRAATVSWCRRVAAWQSLAMTVVSGAVFLWLGRRLELAPLLTVEYTTWAAAATMTLFTACYLQGLRDFVRFNVIRALPAVMPGFLIVLAAPMVRLTPSEAGAAYLIPTWSSAIVGYVWLRRAHEGIAAPRLSPSERRAVWSYGLRSLASFSGLTLNRSADQLALALLVPASSLGIYTVAVAASSPLSSLVASFGMVGLPTVAAIAGRAKSRATWRTLRHATFLVALVAPVLAIALPWAIQLVYGRRYSNAVVPAEFLLLGAVFSALGAVVDDLLRAHGRPGFVSLTQGVGGAVTLIGTVVLDGRPLTAVALVSSLGFLASFTLAIAWLSVATQKLRHRGKHQALRRAARLRPPHVLRP